MNARRVILQELKEAGYVLLRKGEKHDVYFHPELRQIITIRRSFSEKDLVFVRAEIKRNARGQGK